ncbi:MAG: YqjK-like family protein [Rhodoferax sp.]|nr:YqjK-like family protein [Rhodoferax sp.]
MSSDRDQELALRRQRLVMRSAQLRLRLAGQAEVLRAPLALADTAGAAVQWLRRHPYALIGPVMLLAALRPARALRWAGRLWWGWRTFRQTGRWLASTKILRR